jgi:hypothetical protein
MAKYTETMTEFLEKGGQLPASFELIQGFEDLFKNKYCDREIGFETEILFVMKLELTAELYMQVYADRIKKLATAWTGYDAPIKTIYRSEERTLNAGEQNSSSTELPIDALTAKPNLTTKNEAYTNSDSFEYNERISGDTYDEAERKIDFLNKKVHLLINELLNEFEPLFMQIF